MATISGSRKDDYIDTAIVSSGVTGGPATDGADQVAAGAGGDEVHAGGGNDIVGGDGGADRLFGDADNDQLDGGAGDDALHGGEGGDGLVGGDGADRLWGGEGADRLNGGRGHDVSTGESGADIFAISSGRDVVTDFSPIAERLVLIDFEGIAPDGEFTDIPQGYLGLTWDPYAGPGDTTLMAVVDNDASFWFQGDDRGAPNVLQSGEAVGFAADAVNGFPFFSSSSEDFDFVSGWFASAFTDVPLTLYIFGMDDGVQVAAKVVTGFGPEAVFIAFDESFRSIDRIEFGLELSNGSSSENIVMDDLLLRFFGGQGDLLQAGSAAEIADLVASATSDGAGNTILGRGPNTTTLLGIDPGAVSSDWFIV